MLSSRSVFRTPRAARATTPGGLAFATAAAGCFAMAGWVFVAAATAQTNNTPSATRLRAAESVETAAGVAEPVAKSRPTPAVWQPTPLASPATRQASQVVVEEHAAPSVLTPRSRVANRLRYGFPGRSIYPRSYSPGSERSIGGHPVHAGQIGGEVIGEEIPVPAHGKIAPPGAMMAPPGKIEGGPIGPVPGEMMHGGVYQGGVIHDDGHGGDFGGCDTCGDHGGWGACGDGLGCGGCGACNECLIGCPTFNIRNWQFFGGVHGFKGPTSYGEGSFGFHAGVNWARPVPCLPCLGIDFQIGAQGYFSNFSGAEFTDDARSQVFVTAGFFRRVDCGLQGGVVFDYLSEEWAESPAVAGGVIPEDIEAEAAQLRGEISWVFPMGHELGFSFAVPLSTDTVPIPDSRGLGAGGGPLFDTWEPLDQYRFFYRRDFATGAKMRLFGGFTGDEDGLFGADMLFPLNCHFAVTGDFVYVITDDAVNPDTRLGVRTGAPGRTLRPGGEFEHWHIGINLVFQYDGFCCPNYDRPLFDVANPGSFLIQRRQ